MSWFLSFSLREFSWWNWMEICVPFQRAKCPVWNQSTSSSSIYPPNQFPNSQCLYLLDVSPLLFLHSSKSEAFFFCLWQGKNISAWIVLYPVTGSPTWSSPLAASSLVEGDQILWNCCQLMISFIYFSPLWIQICLDLTMILLNKI